MNKEAAATRIADIDRQLQQLRHDHAAIIDSINRLEEERVQVNRVLRGGKSWDVV